MERFNKNKKPDAVQLDINFDEKSKDIKNEEKEGFHGEIEEEYTKENTKSLITGKILDELYDDNDNSELYRIPEINKSKKKGTKETPKPKIHKKSKYRLRPPISGPIDPLA